MFKQLLAILKKGDLVSQAHTDTREMLKKAKTLYIDSIAALIDQTEPDYDIYHLDRQINDMEKDIRRKVLQHLAINPQQDLSAALMITSVIISVERIGDYSKNIYELIKLREKPGKPKIDKPLRKAAHTIQVQFESVEKILEEGDEEKAKEIMETLNPIKKEFDAYIMAAAKTSWSPCKTVINVLFSRYLKRVAAHLENIASGVANPFDMIGFYEGKSDKEAD